MVARSFTRLVLFLAVLMMGSLSCSFFSAPVGGTVAPTLLTPQTQPQEVAPQPQQTQPSNGDTPTPQAAQPTTPVESAAPEELTFTPCDQAVCISDGSFILARPLGPEGRAVVDTSARFGSYRSATRSARHGVSFVNSLGTPVLASAAGTVVVAGDDAQNVYGLYTGMYGNLVILEHDIKVMDGPVYTLYAHLDQISVAGGERVEAGQQIGTVGSSGDVAGSTLYFEVRIGENTYDAAHNPELWLELLQDDQGRPFGALAVQVVNAQGEHPAIPNIVLERLAGPGQPAADTRYAKTYAESRLMGQAPWQESFALADLLPGDYQISFYVNGKLMQQIAPLEAGKLTLATINVP